MQLLTRNQGRLYAYIHAMLGDADRAWDVLQETNLVLWEKADEYDEARPFAPWAYTIAFNQVRKARLLAARHKVMFRDEQTLQSIADDMSARELQLSESEVEVAMEQCLGKLRPEHRELVNRHYHEGQPLKEIAQTLGKKANALAVTLHRVRQSLATCIEGVMGW